MRRIILLFYKYFWLFLSMLFPRNSNIFVFGAWLGEKYEDNSRYFFEYILNNKKEKKVYWITKNEDVYFSLIKKKIPVLKMNSIKAKWIALRAKYIITVTGKEDIGNNYFYTGGAVFINLWHGVVYKKIMYDNEYGLKNAKNGLIFKLKSIPFRKHYLVTTGKTMSNICISAFRINEKNIIELGQPRNDIFFTKHDNIYKEKYGEKKIILYMPTHRNAGKRQLNIEQIFDLERLNSFCLKNNYIFLIKKHFYHRNEPVLTDKYDNIIDITNQSVEVQLLYDAASILITDYSSCFIDYLLLDKPIIFYNFDIEKYYREERTLYFPYDDITPGRKCTDFDSLLDELGNLCKNNDLYHVERKRVKDFFYDKVNQQEVSPLLYERIIKIR